MQHTVCAIIMIALLGTGRAYAQLLVEHFDFTPGQLTPQGPWRQTGTVGTNPVQVVAGSLSYPGYMPPSGNAVRLDGIPNAQDVYAEFGSILGPGTELYAGFLMTATQANRPADYVAHFQHGTTTKVARVFVQTDATSFRIGLDANGTTPQFTPGSYPLNSTVLVVICYAFTTPAHVCRLWVNPSLLDSLPGPDVERTVTQTVTTLSRFGLRQEDGVSTTLIDGLRITGSWQEVPLPVELYSFSARKLETGTELRWRTLTEANNAGFHVERRQLTGWHAEDSQEQRNTWEWRAFVPGAGSSATPLEYRYLDPAPVVYRTAWRLRQVDRDGTEHVTPEVITDAWDVSKDGAAPQIIRSLFPHPVRTRLHFIARVAEAQGPTLRLFDLHGRTVLERHASSAWDTQPGGNGESRRTVLVDLPVHGIRRGWYLLEADADGRVERRHVLIDP